MRVLLLGAGRPVANGFARSLRIAGGYHIIGVCGHQDDCATAEADETHLLPNVKDSGWLLHLIRTTKPDFVHSQSDEGVAALSAVRKQFRVLGVRSFLPPQDHIDICQDKWRSYLVWKEAGLPVPQTVLGRAGDWDWPKMPLHIRPRWGGGGKDSLRKAWVSLANEWIDGKTEPAAYTIAEHLGGGTVTWQAIYRGGALVASQLRRRLAWTNGDHGSARVSETFADRGVEALGARAVKALGGTPNGIYGVDMTQDEKERAHLTEINIGRFFTTIDFFAACGLNMPDYYCRGAPLQETFPMHNPLEGQRWIRCMDREPVLA